MSGSVSDKSQLADDIAELYSFSSGSTDEVEVVVLSVEDYVSVDTGEPVSKVEVIIMVNGTAQTNEEIMSVITETPTDVIEKGLDAELFIGDAVPKNEYTEK
ncbi:uncharacterized protein LOC117118931, partial [Anneissia japonica]|uniref:uncharacterized protein LOC117118931 n=1 Tax=Anneissia japonica TaxID=1529436 RepID=UPI00142578B3